MHVEYILILAPLLKGKAQGEKPMKTKPCQVKHGGYDIDHHHHHHHQHQEEERRKKKEERRKKKEEEADSLSLSLSFSDTERVSVCERVFVRE